MLKLSLDLVRRTLHTCNTSAQSYVCYFNNKSGSRGDKWCWIQYTR